MISRSLLQFCLMLLFFSEISCLDCNRIYVLQTRMNSESLEHLEKMGGNFPFQCLNERTAFKPRDILKIRLSQQENAKVAIQQILQELFHIFTNNLTQAAWNGTSIKEFQNGLHQQIEKLKMCLSAEKAKEITYPGNENLLLTSLKLKRYFQTIDDFLKEKQYSQCAWEIIRVEISRCFPILNILTKRLQDEARDASCNDVMKTAE
ncbi:interferon beta-like [Malaclemys terrapin pileata]|uniref:interferon beta-like n=1 Tax=Malaclemys terrapin pileata TaxID=2991368 RepID=UPI0023A90199|nr:interferon beta-like [Malaclemys terrapin pileata]